MCSGVNLPGGRTRLVSGTGSSDHAGDGVIRAEGTMLKRGRRISIADSRTTDASGRPLAHGTTTCLLFDA